MGQVAANIQERYPTGSVFWVYVRDERPFARRGIGCGWRQFTIESMGTKNTRLLEVGAPEDSYRVNIKRDEFLAMKPLTPDEYKEYLNRPMDGRKKRRK